MAGCVVTQMDDSPALEGLGILARLIAREIGRQGSAHPEDVSHVPELEECD